MHLLLNPLNAFAITIIIIVFSVFKLGLIVAGTIFLLAQLAVIAAWTVMYQRRQKQRDFANSTITSQIPPSSSRTDSMCKLYDTGYASGRHF
jgi:hypothetical protein